MEYNSSREPLILREYGRNVQKLVDFISNEKDDQKRSQYAASLVQLMQQITPQKKDMLENDQKVWDDLHIISDFELEIETPYEKPDKEVINKPPARMPYQKNRIKYLHYGRNIELLINEAKAKTDPKEREEAIIYIGKLMKSFYSTWNKEMIDDQVILDNIQAISGGELTIDIDKVKEENLFERLYKNKKKPSQRPNKSQNRKGGGKRRNRY